MRIPSGKLDQSIYFVAVDATDLKTRETGLATWTVYRSRNGAAEVAYTTPTVSEIDTTNMPGVYALLVDEDTTIGASSDSEEYCVHITHAGMAPVTRTIELYRRDTTSGRTLDVSTGGEAGLDWANVGSPTTSLALTGTTIATTQQVDVNTIKTNPVVNGGTVTFPTNATLASTTNITAGTITTATTATNVTTVNGLAANVITAASLAADAGAEIADAVWDEDATGHQTGGTFGQAIGDPGADTTTIYQSVVTDAAGANVAADIIAIKAQTAAIETDTAEIGAAGAGLTNINLPNQTMDIVGSITGNLSGSVGSVTGAVGSVTGAVGSVTGAVGSVGAGGITAASFAANAITAAKLDPDVTTELQAGLATAAALATVDGIVDDILLDTAEIGAAGAGLTAINLPDQTMNITGNITGNLSGSVGSVTGLTVGTIADQVWEEAIADHSGTVGSTAEALNAAGAAGDPWTTALPGAYGAGSAGFIIGTNINATISSRATQTSVDDLPTNAELATALGTADDAVLAAIDALPTATENADTLLDRSDAIEVGLTPREAMRLSAAADAGKISGAATATNTIRNAVADSKDRIVATVDADGNRTAIIYDLTD